MSLTWEDSNDPSISSVNAEKTATITFANSDVRAVYVDWGDGDSNKKDEANYQWKELTEPKETITLKHTYNKADTFFPVIQTVNSKGFVSRYYSRPSSNTDLIPYSTDSGIAGALVNDIAPSAILKVENVQNNSGIDNSIFDKEGPKQLFIAIAPTLSLAELTGSIGQVTLSVEGISHINTLVQDSSLSTNAQFGLGSMAKQQTFEFDLSFNSNIVGVYNFYKAMNANLISQFSKVLKFKFVSCKGAKPAGGSYGAVDTDYTTNEVFNRLKIFLITKGDDNNYYVISYVTAGSPVKSVDDTERYSILDMGQSRAAASNKTISNYRYDNGKMWLNPSNQ